MRCGDTSACHQQAIQLAGDNCPVGDIVDLHLGESDKTYIEESAPPSDDVVELSADQRILFSQYVWPLDAAGFANTNPGARAD